MGYELYIERTRNRGDVGREPITKAEVDQIVASDPELSWSAMNFIETKDVKIELKGYHGILWLGKRCMWWNGYQISCKNPSGAEIIKMIEIAGLLQAVVVGDEGELYRTEGGDKVVFKK